MGTIEVDAYLRQTSTPAEMEATLRALHRDAESARRALRRPRQARQASSAGAPRLWDAWPVDPRPDDCWRCDAASSADPLGLCRACRADLRR
jgi:hypothetical protein